MQQTIIIQNLQNFSFTKRSAEEEKSSSKKNSDPTSSSVLAKYAKSYETQKSRNIILTLDACVIASNVRTWNKNEKKKKKKIEKMKNMKEGLLRVMGMKGCKLFYYH